MDANVNYLDTLTEPQQLQVYELMAIGDIEDGNVAAKIYIECNYDLNRAIQRWLDRGAGSGISHNTPGAINPVNHSIPDFQDYQAPTQNLPQQRQRNHRNELQTQYKRHIERKAREEEEKSFGESFKQAVDGVVSGFRSIWNAIMPIAIRGEAPGGEQFLTYFRKHYSNLSKQIKFKAGTFESNVLQAQGTKLPMLVYLHIDGSVFRNIPSNVFRSKNLVDFMNNKFHLLGLLMNTEESQKLTKYIETKHCPCLGIFRANLFDEIVLVEYITLTNEIAPEQVLEQLRNLERNHYTITTEEDIIRHEVQRAMHAQRMRNSPFMVQDHYHVQEGDYENAQMFAFYGGAQAQQPQRPQRSEEEQRRLEEARLLRQIQDEEFKEVERKILEQQQKQEEEEKLKKEREEQEKIAQQLKEEEERRKEEEKEMKKKLKSQALPDEPEEGDPSAVLVIFRLPDGGRMERRFRNTDKAESLYDFVDTKDIQFDSTTVRYDLMQPRPFMCLDDKDKTVGDYFEGSNHEVIHVRELTA